MLISDKYKICFIHIPKTGGTSLKQMIKKNDPSAYEYKNFHAPMDNAKDYNKFKNYNKVVVVRNSWQICSSCYRFECQNSRPKFNKTKGMKFKEWLNWKFNNDSLDHKYFPQQLPFFSDEDDNITVDQIIDFDNLKIEVGIMCNTYKWPHNFDKFKAHKNGNYDWQKPYLEDPKNIEYVTEICKKDIEFFGWSYDNSKLSNI